MLRTPRVSQLVIVLALAVISGCAAPWFQDPQLAVTYTRAAQSDSPDRNPVVVIPGLLGTTLEHRDTGEAAWGGFDRISGNPRDPEVLRLLALPFAPGKDGQLNAQDELIPAYVLERASVKLLGLPLDLEVYAGILNVLGVGGYRDESLALAGAVDYGPGHFTCFQFPYDWRRDIVTSAQELMAFMRDRHATVAKALRVNGTPRETLKFDMVTHSMGGLVARYFLMYGDQDLPADGSLPVLNWAGAEFVERVILVGTPNAGSALAFRNLVNGFSLGPLQPEYPPALLGTFASTYQLLPRNSQSAVVWQDSGEPVDDLFDPVLWHRNNWGMLADDQDRLLQDLLPQARTRAARRAAATALQTRMLARAAHFHRAIDRDAPMPPGLEYFAVIGDQTPTPSVFAVAPQDNDLAVKETGYGDGTVLRSSVLNDQRTDDNWTPRIQSPMRFRSVLFLPESHGGLTRSPVFTDNMLYWLLEDPRASAR
ncbi:MAG: hypothetical protein AAF270_13385 [Pseudomonadota bacterium]